MISIKQKRTMISNMIGKEFKIVDTRPLIPGIELIVRSGLRILITLMAEISAPSSEAKFKLIQPRITTRKSSYKIVKILDT